MKNTDKKIQCAEQRRVGARMSWLARFVLNVYSIQWPLCTMNALLFTRLTSSGHFIRSTFFIHKLSFSKKECDHSQKITNTKPQQNNIRIYVKSNNSNQNRIVWIIRFISFLFFCVSRTILSDSQQ